MEIYDIDKLTDEELCSQIICPDVGGMTETEITDCIKENRPGALYLQNFTAEEIAKYTKIANQYSKYPVLIAADIERGPVGKDMDGGAALPNAMAWGACDDEELIERAGMLTGRIMRKRGVHLALAPVVDINFNKNNPIVNIRCPSDSPKQVAKIGGAYMRGMQKDGYLLSSVKHFPGDGLDDRNQHFCTSINSLSKEEWDATYGMVYKKMIEEGVASVMAGHVALPSYGEENPDPILGPLPCILSHRIMTTLLKERMGFKGCIISDAMSMIGSVSMVKSTDELAPRFVKAGGDLVLFPEKNDLKNLLNALKSGFLPRERLKDAVRRVIELKKKARLFEDQKKIADGIDEKAALKELKEISMKIAEKSVKTERDVNNILPLKLKKGDKIMLLNLYQDAFKETEDANKDMFVIEKEFRLRGYEVDVYHRITHYEINRIKDNYAAIIINCDISSTNWRGGDLRLGWRDGIMIFWRGYLFNHKNVVFVSFGDPYKLYELPFLKTYINAFSNSDSSQKAAVKLILGEIKETAKNPVGLEGFFERETD